MKNGCMMLERKKGKDCMFSSLKTLDFKSRDYYIIGDVSGWDQYEVEG
jgi:hypothetical protein